MCKIWCRMFRESVRGSRRSIASSRYAAACTLTGFQTFYSLNLGPLLYSATRPLSHGRNPCGEKYYETGGTLGARLVYMENHRRIQVPNEELQSIHGAPICFCDKISGISSEALLKQPPTKYRKQHGL